MLRSSLGFSTLAFALIVAGCNGGSGPTPTTAIPATGHSANSSFAHLGILHFRHTPPYPPPLRHHVTAADRQRSQQGGWQEVSSEPQWQNGAGTQLLMTDGTVLVSDYCSTTWWRLTPDSTGSYVNGTWSQAASLPSDYGPLYFASAILPNGYVVINGGEYNFCSSAETNLGAIYDPFNNTWSALSGPSGWSNIGDAQSVVLDSGTYMLGNCCYNYQALFNQASSTWTQTGPGNGKQDSNSEEGWTLLPNGNVLVVNITDVPYSQVYNPGTNEWTAAGELPVNVVAPGSFEIGPQTLMPNGQVFVVGSNGKNVLYNTSSGTWTQAKDSPIVDGRQLDVADGPSALLTDGDVMVPESPGVYNSPTSFFLFDGKKFKSITNPPYAQDDSSYDIRLLVLPTGQIMEDDGRSFVDIYTVTKKAKKGLAPVISSVPGTLTAGQTYTATGTGFNGVSQANFYGDDDQQATNYPLVRISMGSSVYYCRTHGFSFMGVASSQSVSTSFDVPSSIPAGTGSLVVVANGVPSKPVTVTIEGSARHRR